MKTADVHYRFCNLLHEELRQLDQVIECNDRPRLILHLKILSRKLQHLAETAEMTSDKPSLWTGTEKKL